MRAQVGLSFDQFFARSQSAKGMFGIRSCSLRPGPGSSFFFQRPMEAQSSTAFTNCSQRGFKLYDSSDESPSANFQINSSVTFENHIHLQLGRSKNWFEPQRQCGRCYLSAYRHLRFANGWSISFPMLLAC